MIFLKGCFGCFYEITFLFDHNYPIESQKKDASIQFDFLNFNLLLFLRFLHFHDKITHEIFSESDNFLSKHLYFWPSHLICLIHFHFLLMFILYLSHYYLILFNCNRLHFFIFILLGFLKKSLLWNIFLISPSKFINLNYFWLFKFYFVF